MAHLPNCHCKNLPACTVDVEALARNVNYSGIAIHHRYLQMPDSDYLAPQPEYGHFMYCCMECNQRWYLECSPEQTPYPIFSLKVNELDCEPGDSHVIAAKHYLSILVHGGFDAEKCRMTGCHNYKLAGLELCHVHIRFP